MFSRSHRLLAVTALAALCLTGCSSAPRPAEPSPGFTSEAEAFAAAEETYRAYVDALNAVDLSDPETFEDVYAWTTGEANAGERRSLTTMHADGLIVSGKTGILAFAGVTRTDDGIVEATACVDVSGVELQNSAGETVVPSSRPDRYSLELQFAEQVTSATHLQIIAIDAVVGDLCV